MIIIEERAAQRPKFSATRISPIEQFTMGGFALLLDAALENSVIFTLTDECYSLKEITGSSPVTIASPRNGADEMHFIWSRGKGCQPHFHLPCARAETSQHLGFLAFTDKTIYLHVHG
jgi:hypothetical protein